MKSVWVPHDPRDQIVDCVNRWSEKTGMAVCSFVLWIGLATSKWHHWKNRYGKVNEHNAWIPRDHWLDEAETIAIGNFHAAHPLEGYRCLTFMMLNADVVAASPSSVYRVLQRAGVLELAPDDQGGLPPHADALEPGRRPAHRGRLARQAFFFFFFCVLDYLHGERGV